MVVLRRRYGVVYYLGICLCKEQFTVISLFFITVVNKNKEDLIANGQKKDFMQYEKVIKENKGRLLHNTRRLFEETVSLHVHML